MIDPETQSDEDVASPALIDAYLERCFAFEAPPRVSELASFLGIARETLSRRFTDRNNCTLTAYLKERQLAHARALLRQSALPIARIGYLSGFGTRRTFHRAFLRATGITPSTYRNEMSG